jgi:hypothetical protein
MSYPTLNCPKCRRQLVYVPREGLTLYYHCVVHGPVILRPLVLLDDQHDSWPDRVENDWPEYGR